MNEIKVVGWISYDEATKHKESAGGMGGWFNWKVKGMRWKDYIETIKPEYVPYYEAIRHEVVSKNLRITGEQHQDDYAPFHSNRNVCTTDCVSQDG